MKSFYAFVAAVLLCASLPVLADSHLSSDPAIEYARGLVANGRFDEALDVLRPLVPDHPDRTDVLFLVGLAAVEAARLRDAEAAERTALLDEAIAALRTLLIDRPDLVRVRLELARAFFLKGEDNLSQDHFERVLAGRPVPAVAANIHRFLAAMRARRRWSVYAGGALAPDSNLGATSEAETIYLYGLPFRREAEVKSGVGVVVWGGGEYQHPLSDRLRLRAGADVFRREYGGRDFDQTFVSIHAGPRWLMDAKTEANLLATAQRRWTAGDSQSHDLGGRLEVSRLLGQRLTVRGQASWRQRSYQEREDLDGPLLDLSLRTGWAVTPTVRANVAVGYDRERTESIQWRNSTRWTRAGLSVALPMGFTVGGSGALHWTRYDGSWPQFVRDGGSRKDRTRTLRVSVFNRGLTVFGFSPQLVLVNETRISNAQLYDYRRSRAELLFQRQF